MSSSATQTVIEEPREGERSDRVPWPSKAAFGLGGLADYLSIALVNVMATPIYLVALHMNPGLLGTAMAFPRLAGAVFDTIVGVRSDNTRSRWGRRRPYIFIGAILTGSLLPLLWFPPKTMGDHAMFIFIVVILSVFQLAHSIWATPMAALSFEATSDPNERTRLLAWRPYFTTIGHFIVPWFYYLSLRPIFNDPTGLTGVRWLGLGVGLVVVALGILPAVMFTEKRQAQASTKMRALDAIRQTAGNRSFLVLLAGYVVVIFGMNCEGMIGFYLGVYYICHGDTVAASKLNGTIGMITALSTFAAVPMATWLSTRIGKRGATFIGLSLCSLGGLMSWWTISPAWPYLMLCNLLTAKFGVDTTNLMVASMTTDVCDEDELHTGRRREGAYAAATGLTLKLTIASMSIVGGFLPVLAGYTNAKIAPTPEQIDNMRLIYAGLQFTLPLIALVLYLYYPLTMQRCAEIRQQLRQRASTSAGTAQVQS